MVHKDVAIPVVFPDYRIAVNTPAVTVRVPDVLPFFDVLPDRLRVPATKNKVDHLGHAGILFLQGKTGLTHYYEYGRYDPADLGLARKQPVPDVKMGTNGRPTRKSLEKVLAVISSRAGQQGRITGAYIEVEPGAFVRMDGYATARIQKNRDVKREPYDLLANSCLHFMKSVAEAGGARMPTVVAPHPAGYIFQVQMQERDLEFDLTGRMTVEGLQFE